MAVRPIDAEKYMELLKEQYLHNKSMGNSQAARAWQGAMQLLYDMPTLTPPNELMEALEAINNAAVAYIEGGPYENDLPGMELAVEIDRLSRDFVRPPNEPLTLDELMKMDGEPVYVVFRPGVSGEKPQFWALVSVDEWNDVYLANKEGWAFNYEKFLEDVEGIYRRPRDRRTHELRHIPDRPRQPRADRA